MKKEWLSGLQTPCVVIDVRIVRENIERMQQLCNALGVKLRPHIKTHKMPYFMNMQLAAGCDGITCAKVGEAEVMAEAGAQDIFIAYPMVGPARIARVVQLARRVRRLILGIDSRETALLLSQAAVEAGLVLEVRMEVDTGAKRTGIPREQAVSLARYVQGLPGLRLTGIYTFKGLIYQGNPSLDPEQSGREEGQILAEVAACLRDAGVPVVEISGGSTPTGPAVARTGKVTEIRPGTYLFNDVMTVREGAARMDQIAARVYATVVSAPRPAYAVIDGGCKTFSTDVIPGRPPYDYPGYALIDDREDLCFSRMNEEHGILTSSTGHTGLQPGQVLSLLPLHVCTTINLHNQVYLYDGVRLWQEKVAARGMLV